MTLTAKTTFSTKSDEFAAEAMRFFARHRPALLSLASSQYGELQAILLRYRPTDQLVLALKTRLLKQHGKALSKERLGQGEAYAALLKLLEDAKTIVEQAAEDELAEVKARQGTIVSAAFCRQLELLVIHSMFDKLIKLFRIFEMEDQCPLVPRKILEDLASCLPN